MVYFPFVLDGASAVAASFVRPFKGGTGGLTLIFRRESMWACESAANLESTFFSGKVNCRENRLRF